LVERAEKIGEKLSHRLTAWRDRHPMVGEVRGLGAMMAVELVKDKRSKEPAKEFTLDLVARCGQRGVLLIYAGTHSNVLRFLVPLVISDEQLEEGLQVIEEVLFA
jgi:4-aminobutyrate aminotransferase/(S)-3-amino-2-methylpropionate transaminase